MNDDQIRDEWVRAGGSMHGPNIETVTMPESDYLKFRRALLAKDASEKAFLSALEVASRRAMVIVHFHDSDKGFFTVRADGYGAWGSTFTEAAAQFVQMERNR